jgi:hypothetical protein
MNIIGYKENGVCRVIRTLGVGSSIANIVSKVHITDTFSRCLISLDGPVLIFAIGWAATAQAAICDADLFNPAETIDHVYLRTVFCPHCQEVLKKRKLLGDDGNLDPLLTMVFVSKGIFYSCDIKKGSVIESDSFVAPDPYDDAAFFGTIANSSKKGWALLEEAMDADLRLSVSETYPLVRIDDERFTFEFKMTPESDWEACKI